MNKAAPLTIDTTTLNSITKLATAAKGDPDGERKLYFLLARLTPEEQAEVYALYNLGRAGVRSFNKALSGAQGQNLEHVPGMLAEKANLATCLRAGIKRYRRQS